MHRAVHQKRRAFPLLRSGTTLTVAAARGRQQGECKTFAWRAHPNGAARSALAARATPRVPMDPRASLRCSALPQNMKRGSCLRASPSSSIWPPRSATISVVSATLWSLPQPGDRTGGTPEEPRRVATAWSSSARHRSSGCAAPRRRGAFGLGVDLRVQRTRTPPRLRRQTSNTARSPWCGGAIAVPRERRSDVDRVQWSPCGVPERFSRSSTSIRATHEIGRPRILGGLETAAPQDRGGL